MSAAYAGRRVAVTGASGFIGRRLTRQLQACGAEVVNLNRPDFDLLEPEMAAAAVKAARPEIVFHLAAAGVGELFGDETGKVAVNAMGTEAVLRGAREGGVSRVVCFGTCFEYAPSATPLAETAALSPRNPYAASKAMAHEAAREAVAVFGQDVVWLRPFAVYGPGQPTAKLIPSLIEAAMAGRRLELGGGTAAWDYVHVYDVAAAALILGVHPAAARGVFNCGTGAAHAARDIAAMLEKLTGRSPPLAWGARSDRPGDPIFMCADAARLRSLGWMPRFDLAAGLASLVPADAGA